MNYGLGGDAPYATLNPFSLTSGGVVESLPESIVTAGAQQEQGQTTRWMLAVVGACALLIVVMQVS